MELYKNSLERTMRGFYNVCNFTGVAGDIDYTHLPIISSGGNNTQIQKSS